MKSLNETPIFWSVACSLFPKAIFLTFILLPNVVYKKAGCVANSVDPDETLHLRRLIWVYTVCSGLSDQIYTVKYNI